MVAEVMIGVTAGADSAEAAVTGAKTGVAGSTKFSVAEPGKGNSVEALAEAAELTLSGVLVVVCSPTLVADSIVWASGVRRKRVT
jgi:hypothetical protein